MKNREEARVALPHPSNQNSELLSSQGTNMSVYRPNRQANRLNLSGAMPIRVGDREDHEGR